MYSLSDYDYVLPKECIAQEPLKNRTDAKLLIVGKTLEHKHIYDLPELLQKDDVLVLNDSKVIPARLIGKKETGGKIEIILTKKVTENNWHCFFTGKITKPTTVFFTQGTGHLQPGNPPTITLNNVLLHKVGIMPTPPYIKKTLREPERYNTVFAREEGSIAAPTAGLHFTPELIEQIKQKGIQVVFVTLHVGIGTFLPVKTEDIRQHHMHEEHYTISHKTAHIINTRTGRLVIAGTTTLRTLESATTQNGIVQPKTSTTNIFIHPPYTFKLSFDALLTNFHLPKSTLLMLVSAITGRERILETYTTAIKEQYRFFSFGDSMLIFSNSFSNSRAHTRN